MPIDASIYGETKLFQPDSPVHTVAKLAGFQELQQQIIDRKQAAQDEAAMRAAVQQSGGDYEKAIHSLNTTGNVSAAQSLQGAWDKHQEAAGKALEAHLKAQDAQLGYYSHLAGLIDSDASQKAVLATLSPEEQQRVAPLLGDTYDPDRVSKVRDVLLSAKDRAQIQHDAVMDWQTGTKSMQDGVTTFAKYLSATPQAQWGQMVAGAKSLGIPQASIDFVMQNAQTPEQAAALANKKEDAAAKVGSFEDYVTRTYGANPTPTQILAARKAYGQADDRPLRGTVQMVPTAAPGTTFEDLAKGTGMSPTAIKIASQRYLEDGSLPTRINERSKQAIMNGAALISPDANVASNVAQYGADKASLKNIQGILDSIQAFHPAAIANLKQFDDLFKQVPDTKSPFFNTPVRQLDEKLFGNTKVSAARTALGVATREIARITSNPRLTGQLTDAAREEVSNFIPANATLAQAREVMGVLSNDLNNVEKGQRDQLARIQYRIANPGKSASEAPSQPLSPNDVVAPNGKTYHFATKAQADAFKAKAGIP